MSPTIEPGGTVATASPGRTSSTTAATATAAPAAGTWRPARGATTLTLDGAELARYDHGSTVERVHSPRPFLHPVRTLGGTVLTDLAPADHLHHLGLSAALPDVDGTSFWGGRTYVRDQGSTLLDNHGRQRVAETRIPSTDDERERAGADVVQLLTWDDEDDAPVLHEVRTLTARTLGDAWTLRWTSTLRADVRDLSLGSPATNGRPGAGYGGLFWRLGDADVTVVLSEDGTGEEVAHGSTSRWVAFVQSTGDVTTTLVLVQPGTDRRPWFLRASEYDGAGPAAAWSERVSLPRGRELTLELVAVLVDGPVEDHAVAELVARADQALTGGC